MSCQFTEDVSLYTSTQIISLNTLTTISLCAICARKDLSGQFTEDVSLYTSTQIISLNTLTTISLCAICARKDLSGQFTEDVSLEPSTYIISLNMPPKIFICAINIGKIYLANLLKLSRCRPPPRILIITRCRRFLSAPYLQERFLLLIY